MPFCGRNKITLEPYLIFIQLVVRYLNLFQIHIYKCCNKGNHVKEWNMDYNACEKSTLIAKFPLVQAKGLKNTSFLWSAQINN